MSRKKIHLDKKILGHRIQMVLDYAGIEQDKASELLEISKQSLNRYINSKRDPGAQLINQLVLKFNFFNPEWLLTGEGEMLKKPTSIAAESHEPYINKGRNTEVNDLLQAAKRVLESDNPVAFDALERNLRYFDHAVAVEKRLKSLEDRLRMLEEKAGDCDPCPPDRATEAG